MMAASVIRNGMAGIDSAPAIPPSQHSSSMHESCVSPPSSSAPSTATHSSPSVVNNNEDSDEGQLGSTDKMSSISPAGKKLAVSSGQGPSASLVSSSALIHEDETDIALSQLKELEVAIEVRKVTRVDGRKTRWIEYRREKQADIQATQKSKSKSYSHKAKGLQNKPSFKPRKPIKRSTKSSSVAPLIKNTSSKDLPKVCETKKPGKKSTKSPGKPLLPVSLNKSITDKSPKSFEDSSEEANDCIVNGKLIKEDKGDNPLISNIINNNNNNNNIDNLKNKLESNMKVEVSSPVISTLGTLETMKHQFLQGTVDVSLNGVAKEKEKPLRKRPKTANGAAPINHVNNVLKRKPGRPKKVFDIKAPLSSKIQNSNTVPKSEPISAPQPAESSVSPDNSPPSNKKGDLPPMGQSATEFYSRRNFLTKGLREVRKSESGSESGGSSPIKDGSPCLSPSPQISFSPIPHVSPIGSEPTNTIGTNSIKCPLISAAAKVLSTGVKKQKTTNGLSMKKKKMLRKMSKREIKNTAAETNGHDSISSHPISKNEKESAKKGVKPVFVINKRGRGRGRKPKCKADDVPPKWAKQTSTVIVDVHNTMNGEPQTVIPVQNPIVLRKKKSSPPKVLFKSTSSSSETPIDAEHNKSDLKNTLDFPRFSNKVKENVPTVPEIVDTSPLILQPPSPSFTSRKLSNSQSASKFSQITEPGKFDSTKAKIESNTDDILQDKDVPDSLSTTSLLSSETKNINNFDNVEESGMKNGEIENRIIDGMENGITSEIECIKIEKEVIDLTSNLDCVNKPICDSEAPTKNVKVDEKISNDISSHDIQTLSENNNTKKCEKQVLSNAKSSERSHKVKDLKQVVRKSSGSVSIMGGESIRKHNNGDINQKTIKEFMKPIVNSAKDSKSSVSSSLLNVTPTNVVTDSDLESNVDGDKNIYNCIPKNDSLSIIESNPVASNLNNVNSEPKNGHITNSQPSTSTAEVSTANKSLCVKSPEKKVKTLKAVLEQLHSRTSHNDATVSTSVSDSKAAASLPKPNATSPTENVSRHPLSSTSTSENVSISKDLNYGPVETEQSSQNTVTTKEQIQPEKKKVKSQQSSTLNNNTKAQGTSGKPKEKVPRFLKQLFQDEGVQNMLRSVNEEVIPSVDANSGLDSGASHKLRPKRAHENFISDSPEPDDSLVIQGSKRKKRGTEVDNLFVDEGALNLLTSLEVGSRRPSSLDEFTGEEVSQSNSISNSSKPTNAAVRVSKGQTEDQQGELGGTKKRKLSGTSNSITVGKVLYSQEKEVKKMKVDAPKQDVPPTKIKVESERQNYNTEEPKLTTNTNNNNNNNIDKQKKKPGRPAVAVPIKPKTKAQVIINYRKQLTNLGISSEGLSLPEMRDILKKSKGPVKTTFVKSVPPIKIKISPGQERISSKPVPNSNTLERKQSLMQEKGSRVIENSNSERRVEYPRHPEPSRSSIGTPNSEGSPSSTNVMRVSKTGTPNSIPSSNGARSYSLEKPRNSTSFGDRPILNRHSGTGLPRKSFSLSRNSPQPPPITSLVRPLDSASASQKSRFRGPGEGVRHSQRTSVRQSEGNYHYRDISLRRFNNFMQIILTPSTTKMKNSLNSRVLRELCEALNTLRRDESVRMVLLSSTGSTFCQGIDLTSLQHPNLDTRKKNAENLARGIKDFLRALVQFPKVIVAGVNGSAMGLGVTMLPLFDMVYATDKAEFFLPYAKLGQVPEGGATYTFPNYYGKLQSNQLFLGQKITAVQAQQIGLVSESIWPATFNQELIPKVALLASQSTQSMEGTKALMNHHIITKLELSVESECRLLLQQWTSQNFYNLSKRFLDTSEVQLQKPVNLPL